MNDPKRLVDEGGHADLVRLLAAGRSELPDPGRIAAIGAKAGLAGGAASATTAGKLGLALKLALATVTAVGIVSVVAVVRRAPPPAPPVGLVATVTPPPAIAESAPAPASPIEPPAPSTTAKTTRTAPVASVMDTSPEAEVRLLERAQDALRSRPAEALVLADEHAHRFPGGLLVQEREVIAIEALMKTNRAGEARARAQRFETRFPGSSHARRIEALIAD